MILTSNTEATENKVQFFNLAYRVKGFQCHSNNSLQLLELKDFNIWNKNLQSNKNEATKSSNNSAIINFIFYSFIHTLNLKINC